MTGPMSKPPTLPKLRPVDSFVATRDDGEPCLVLRDPEGVAHGPVFVPLVLAPVVARFKGRHTTARIRAILLHDEGLDVPLDVIDDAARTLDDALFLEGQAFERARRDAEAAFARADVREAAFAGSAYPGEREELSTYVETACIGGRHRAEESLSPTDRLAGMVMPHIDPWRGARGYGACVDALVRALPREPKTFVLLGTSHAPMSAPYSVCEKVFATPLGALRPARGAIARLRGAMRFDDTADLLGHRNEHSIELAAVFLRYALDRLGASEGSTIVPVLCGLGAARARREDPRSDGGTASFLDGLRRLVADEGAIVIAAADLAHVGPRFGDPRALDRGARAELEARDRASMSLARERDASAFFDHVVEDQTSRRVCGAACVYTLLDVLGGASKGKVLYYDQNVDPEEGSIVSHAGLAFVE
jgi:AmmeMemoRadiSam system protein B